MHQTSEEQRAQTRERVRRFRIQRAYGMIAENVETLPRLVAPSAGCEAEVANTKPAMAGRAEGLSGSAKIRRR
jgi:hypothetical protein